MRIALTARTTTHTRDPAAVGRRLKDARVQAGLSQRQLSFPGCSAAYISRLEAGDRVPSLQLLRKLAAKLTADEEFLATGVARVQQTPPELVEAEVERRLGGHERDAEANGQSGASTIRRVARACSGSIALLASERPAGGPFARGALACRLRRDASRGPGRVTTFGAASAGAVETATPD